jgi:hypothetical protein
MQDSLPKYQSNKQYQYTPAERAYYRREKSESVGTILEAVAVEAKDEIALALAHRIKKCASRYNSFIAKDLNNKSGECFDGFGTLFSCGSKLCHSCMTKAAKRNRKIAGEVLDVIKLRKKGYLPFGAKKKVIEQQRLRMITLTMPKVSLSCIESIELVARAFKLFRKLKFTETYFDGYIKSIEFTVREDKTYHAHIHLLAVSFFIPESLIKRLWRRCVQTAFAEKKLDWRVATKSLKNDDKLNVNLKLADPNENSLKEVCKYLTKSESWENIPTSDLLELANLKRWRRMFELTGCFKKAAQWIRAKNEAIKQARLAESSEVTYRIVCKGIERQTIGLRDDFKNPFALKSFIASLNKRFPERRYTIEINQNYLDEKRISAAENSTSDSESKAKLVVKRENWRDTIEKLGVERYLKILEGQVEAIQKIRKELLIEKYPLATFTDLAGFPWYEPDIDFVEGFTENSMEMRA